MIIKMMQAILRVVFFLFTPVKSVSGSRPDKSFIVCSNHSSHADTAAIMQALELRFDEVAPFAAEDYFFKNEKFSLRSLPKKIFPYLTPVSRKSSKSKLSSGLKLHASVPRILLVYPEGTRSKREVIGKFKHGIAELSRNSGLPVLPIYVNGTKNVLPKDRYFPSRHHVTVDIGELITVAESETDSEFADRLRDKILKLRSARHYPRPKQ